jgi:hypothetical protein
VLQQYTGIKKEIAGFSTRVETGNFFKVYMLKTPYL